MYLPTTIDHAEPFPSSCYRFGKKAYLSTNSLLDHLVQHYPDNPFLSDLDTEWTYAEVDMLVNTIARDLVERDGLSARKKGEEAKVVGMAWRAGVHYVLYEFALNRL